MRNPADALDLVQLIQQLADAVLAPVVAVGGGILGHQHQLLHAFVGQPAGLGQAVLHGAAAQRAANQRNGTVVAAVVAALGNFQIGIVMGGGDHPSTAQGKIGLGAIVLPVLVLRAAAQPVDDLGNGLVGADAHHRIHLGNLGADLMLVPLGQAAGNHHLQVGVLFLIGAGVQDILDGLSLCTLNKAAGVHDDHIRQAQVGGGGVAGSDETVAHHVGIHLIFGAAQRNDCDIQCSILLFARWFTPLRALCAF